MSVKSNILSCSFLLIKVRNIVHLHSVYIVCSCLQACNCSEVLGSSGDENMRMDYLSLLKAGVLDDAFPAEF